MRVGQEVRPEGAGMGMVMEVGMEVGMGMANPAHIFLPQMGWLRRVQLLSPLLKSARRQRPHLGCIVISLR